MKKAEGLEDPGAEIRTALDHPSAGRRWRMVGEREKTLGQLKVAVTVSDITRPVPYRGKKGFLPPLLKKLQALGVLRENIVIIVGTGTHRASTPEEKVEMLGQEIAGLCDSGP